MDKLLTYLNGLSPQERDAFAKRCHTTVGYLRKACSVGQSLSEGMCLRIAAESANAVTPEHLRPDVNWSYIRTALANTAHQATENVAHGAASV